MPVDSRPRVAIDATALVGPRTGVGVMTAAIIERLLGSDEIDLQPLLVSLRGRRDLKAQLRSGPTAPGSSTPPMRAPHSRALWAPARLAHQLWQRFDWPAVRNVDVVHGPNFVVPPAAKGAELVTIHDFGPWRDPDLVTEHARAYPILVDRALARGAHVHVVSDFVGVEAQERLGIAAERVHVIRNGFEAGTRGDARLGRALAGGPFVLFIGTIEPRKDLPTLVGAMADAWGEGLEHRLVVAGPDGWGSDAYEEAVARIGPAAERVHRVGYVTDAERSDLLAGASCLAYPSRYEGFGLPPLEAMAQDCPVVTTGAGALSETCGPAARYVDVGDTAGLAAAITEVVTDDAVAAGLVAAGRERIEQFSWDDTADRLAALYHSLAA
ncbi:MAG: glycosyltransferase family 4 protein [Acidimicrobiales bacterium]